MPAATLLDTDELRDHMPALIDRLLDILSEGAPPSVGDLPAKHAIERLKEGFNLEQVAWEYSILRSTLLRLNEEEGAVLTPSAIVLLNDAIDQAVIQAVSRFHHARIRMLEALERLAQEGLFEEPQPLDTLLHRLLRVMVDTVGSLDTAVIFLREWDRLVLRAAIGIEASIQDTFSLAVGEGFAGTIAKTRQPLLTHSAESDPLVRNPVLKMNGVKALYGVPLLYGDAVVGVVKMGSRTAVDFPAEERQIIRSAADRAAAFIARKRTAEEQELLLHILGHDLRSPLHTIGLSSESIEQQEPLSAAGKRKIARVIAAARRMDHVIGDLTDFTATRRSRLVIQREKLDLYDLAAQTASEMQARTERPILVDRKGNTTGEWDRGRLFRVIVNLVSNALAYGAQGTPVKISIEDEGDLVSLCVHNEGEPIAPALLPHLYEAFRRGNEGTGSGLGLYIVQQIARAHGGEVDVESAAGRGTSFRVRLPRTAP